MRIIQRACHWLLHIATVLAAGAVALDVSGRRAIREAASAPRSPQTGIMLGAEPLRVDRGRAGACLLLHGWGGSPADFGDLPKALDEAGWDVYAPLHTGHGTSPADLEGVKAQALLDGARARYADLRAQYKKIALVGFSIGGTLATILSAERPPDGLVLLAPFYEVTYKPYYVLPARWWHALLRPFVRYVARPQWMIQVNRPEGRGHLVEYNALPTGSMQAPFCLRRHALEEAGLARLQMPLLMLYSRGDEVSSPAAMAEFYRRLPDGRKAMATFERSNHHILHDYDREAAIRAIVEFVNGRLAAGPAG